MKRYRLKKEWVELGSIIANVAIGTTVFRAVYFGEYDHWSFKILLFICFFCLIHDGIQLMEKKRKTATAYGMFKTNHAKKNVMKKENIA